MVNGAVARQEANSFAGGLLGATSRAATVRLGKLIAEGIENAGTSAGEKVKRLLEQDSKPSEVKRMKASIKRLEKASCCDLSTARYYTNTTPVNNVSAIGETGYTQIDNFAIGEVEDMVSALRFFDPSAPATLVTANTTLGNYNRDISIKGMESTLVLSTELTFPVEVEVYCCHPKAPLMSSPYDSVTSGLTAQGCSVHTSPLVYPQMSDTFRENWRVSKVVKKTLLPGTVLEVTISDKKEFSFNTQSIISGGDHSQPRIHTSWFLIRYVGRLARGPLDIDPVTIYRSKIVSYVKRKAIIQYDAGGVKLNDLQVTDSFGSTLSASSFTSNPYRPTAGV